MENWSRLLKQVISRPSYQFSRRTATWLVQFDVCRSAEREAAGSKPRPDGDSALVAPSSIPCKYNKFRGTLKNPLTVRRE